MGTGLSKDLKRKREDDPKDEAHNEKSERKKARHGRGDEGNVCTGIEERAKRCRRHRPRCRCAWCTFVESFAEANDFGRCANQECLKHLSQGTLERHEKSKSLPGGGGGGGGNDDARTVCRYCDGCAESGNLWCYACGQLVDRETLRCNAGWILSARDPDYEDEECDDDESESDGSEEHDCGGGGGGGDDIGNGSDTNSDDDNEERNGEVGGGGGEDGDGGGEREGEAESVSERKSKVKSPVNASARLDGDTFTLDSIARAFAETNSNTPCVYDEATLRSAQSRVALTGRQAHPDGDGGNDKPARGLQGRRAELTHVCSACGGDGWWCRCCGGAQKMKALVALGVDTTMASEFVDIQRAGADADAVPCLVCNGRALRPHPDPDRRAAKDFWVDMLRTKA